MCTIIGYKSLKVDKESIHQALLATYTRGPDDERIQEVGCGYIGFQRLSIMGLSPLGMRHLKEMEIMSYVTVRSMAFEPSKMNLKKTAIHLSHKATVKFFYHSMKNTA